MTEDDREGMETLLLELSMDAERTWPTRLAEGELRVTILDAGESWLGLGVKLVSWDCIVLSIVLGTDERAQKDAYVEGDAIVVSGRKRRVASQKHGDREARCVRHGIDAAKSYLKVPLLERDPLTSVTLGAIKGECEAAERIVRIAKGGSEDANADQAVVE